MSEDLGKYLHNLTNKFMASDAKLKVASQTDNLEKLKKDVNKALELNKEVMIILKDLKTFVDNN